MYLLRFVFKFSTAMLQHVDLAVSRYGYESCNLHLSKQYSNEH